MKKKILALFVPVDGPLRKIWINPHFEDFNDQIAAGTGTIVSSIETPAYGKLDAWVDDEGLLIGAPVNERLTRIIQYPYTNVHSASLIYGDGILFSSNDEGETIGLSESIANNLLNQYNWQSIP